MENSTAVQILKAHICIMNRFILFTSLLLISAGTLSAQSVRKSLDTYMSEVRKGSYKPVPDEILNTTNPSDLFKNLESYATDSVDLIRSKAYYIYQKAGQKSAKRAVKTLAINQLIKGLSDRNGGLTGNVMDYLAGFSKEDFDAGQKAAIASYIQPETPHLDQLLMLAGYIPLIEYKNKINAIVSSDLGMKYKWAARLALARMGDEEAIAYFANKLRSAPVNDDFVYDYVPDLIYTRQLAIYQFLETIIMSDEKNCYSANPDSNAKILCGYRVMEYIAPTIQGFPLPIDEFGELEVDDYEVALRQLRTWFTQNDNYVILDSTY